MSFVLTTSNSAPALAGFGFGLTLMLSLGPRNTHLIRQGLSRNFALTTATTGYLSDVVLVLASLAGVGSLIAGAPGLVRLLGWLGAGFLAFCGARGLIAAIRAPAVSMVGARQPTWARAAATMLAVTWANPLYYIQVLIPFGWLSTRFDSAHGAQLFGAGMLIASFARFYGYTFAATRLSRFFGRPGALRAFEMAAAGLLLILAVGAGATMLQQDGAAAAMPHQDQNIGNAQLSVEANWR
jgi:L-lysine exporter family protein LysE/ArgO